MMRASLLGHASLIIEAACTRVITDPLFFGPGERTLDPCPKRLVHLDKLGALQAIVISHRHLDHFDDESLQRLDRRLPMVMPRDPELAARARGLGFATVHELAPWEELELGGLRLMVTPSHRNDVAEMGMVFMATDAVLWNQVDTVVDQSTCVRVLERTGGVDVAFCAYNPLLEHATMWYAETDFPQARYERLLEMASCSEARLVVPGSFGLRMVGKYADFNQRCYPVSRERFVEDFKRLAPEREAWIVNPGEAIEVGRGTVPRKVAHDCATMLEDDTRLTYFAPDGALPELVDENPTRFPDRELERGLTHIVTRVWPKVAGDLLEKHQGGPLLTLKSRRAVVDLEVVFPRATKRWRVTRWVPTPEVVEAGDGEADYTFTYVASQIYAVAVGRAYQNPEILARRARSARPGGLTPLDPARLSGVDGYATTDENFGWSPLDILAGHHL